MDDKRPVLWIYLALLADVVLFFHKPLLNAAYLFPWDFRGVHVPSFSGSPFSVSKSFTITE